MRRGAGVVERDGFEIRCTCKGTQGSNPCLSATICSATFISVMLQQKYLQFMSTLGRVIHTKAFVKGSVFPVFSSL